MNAFDSAIAQIIAAPVSTHTKAVPSTVGEKPKAKPIKATAEKPISKGATAVPKAQAARVAIPFGIHDGYRPKAGARLFAFSHAWLSLSGMAAGKAYPKAQAIKVAGATAIAYHKGNGNFVERDGMLTISEMGHQFFGKMRANDPAMVQRWIDVLTTGKPDGEFIKNADCLRKIEA